MCGGHAFQRYGRTAQGKQRWRCRGCGRTSVQRGLPRRRQRQQVWFHRWVCEGYGIRQLSQQSGLSERTLRRVIHYWLDRPPDVSRLDLSVYRHVLVDSIYLRGRRSTVTVVMDATTHQVIAGIYGVHESEAAMAGFCVQLARQGLNPINLTTDGQPKLMAHLAHAWPHAILQRCLVHLQRQGLSWCRRRPTRTDAKHLRNLFRTLPSLKTRRAGARWLDRLIAWEQRYGSQIAILPERGYVFSDLKRARSSLVRALPHMFHCLHRRQIAGNTNALEGYFSRLRRQYVQHRGLSHPHRRAYIQWYLHLQRR